jgi:hypothetical protein
LIIHLTSFPQRILSFSRSPSLSIVASLLVIPHPQLGIDLLKFFKLMRFSMYESGIKKVLSSYNAALQRMALLSVQIIIGGSWLACMYFTLGGRLSLPLAVGDAHFPHLHLFCCFRNAYSFPI